MENNFRSGCPIASTLDIVGDKWSLLIIRDMLLQGKRTFKDFSSSPEGIAPGILSARLKWLEENELITKQKLPDNQKENIYLLTEKGIELTPIITEIILWSDKNLRVQNAEMFSIAEAGFNQDKSKVTEGIQNNYRQLVEEILG
ncbi:helix-turn-helix transcriptional regulator [Polaribacter litorisediminis]|uniref:winged helix-turn-helix transcriptional regulator n=1 Tax=Polaribacter litorisediminis TaxID=1908341 RepID=UPI001CBDFCD7|nr:helix-turn-helix domain-containing protein [Polaribacter litorisediminis]UAM99866.1 helix-turn-helix transcriptional regulator [Polaribacter litorisediminis]